MSETVVACIPNFSAAGRARRVLSARISAVGTVVLWGALLAVDAPAPALALLALPTGAAFVSALQVRRNTCVMHAATGNFERDDFSTEKVDAARAAASRRVAATIWRDALLGTALVVAVAVASALVL
jgi:hypothetical protein